MGSTHSIFYIKYAPGTIFSNEVPGLDANFIQPKYNFENKFEVTSLPGYKKDESVDLSNSEYTLDGALNTMYRVLRDDKGEKEEDGSPISRVYFEQNLKIIISFTDDSDAGSQIAFYYKNKYCYVLCTLENDASHRLWFVLNNFNRFNGDNPDDSDYIFYYGTGGRNDLKQVYKTKVIMPQGFIDFFYYFKDLYSGTNAILMIIGNPMWIYNIFVQDGDIVGVTEEEVEAGGILWKDAVDGIIKNAHEEERNYWYENQDSQNVGYLVSTSYELRKTVATWYRALRAIALVGLLSILVYVGIRIIISSTGQEKAKYKKMLVDWLAAMCLLFILQYIMVFIMSITESITKILSVNTVGENGEDVLLSNLRNNIGYSVNFSRIFADIVLYIVLIVYTIMFTIQYLKRLIYMAFFTMIAPLVALTYPLDKIKDGQAQAFTIWIREYTFNALLQPMHLLIYSIFVGSAIAFAKSNVLYAIVVIGFMLPAEKFFRKMFGFDKSSSTSQLGAAAGGALVMNAINKMGQKTGKHATRKSEGEESGTSGGTSRGNTPRYVRNPNSGAEETKGGTTRGTTRGTLGGEAKKEGSESIGKASDERKMWGENINNASYGNANLKNGVKTLAGRYFNKGNIKNKAKSLGRIGRRGILGAAGAATLGTIGLGIGVATGDASKALQYSAMGAGIGYSAANNLGDRALDLEKRNREIFKEGALGTDEYNARNTVNELTQDGDFNKACQDLGITDKENVIRQFYSNGITSANDIKKAINARAITGRSQDQILAVSKIKKRAEQYSMKPRDIEAELESKGVNKSEIKDIINLMDLL